MSTIRRISAQDILNSFLSKKNDKELAISYGLSEGTLVEGKLDLSLFTNLETLLLGSGIFSVLDFDKTKNLPIKKLSIDRPLKEEENLDLKGFPNLTEFRIFGHFKIKSLDLTNNAKLELVELQGEVTERLDLKVFSHLTNLKKLDLGLIGGSYKSLEKCVNLRYLSIVGDYYDFEVPKDGLEYLDLDKLEYLCLGSVQYLPYKATSDFPETGVYRSSDSLGKMLEPYRYDIKVWKKDMVDGPDNSLIQLRVKVKELTNKIQAHKTRINQIINE